MNSNNNSNQKSSTETSSAQRVTEGVAVMVIGTVVLGAVGFALGGPAGAVIGSKIALAAGVGQAT
jgi:hypothetical protein